MKIALIGAGNLATHLGRGFQKADHEIVQVYSRLMTNAKTLAAELDCEYTHDINDINAKADVYFIALKDDSLESFLRKFKRPGKIVIHTSASISMDILNQSSKDFGVFYPLQSFTKNRKIQLTDIPVFIEGNSTKSKKALTELANSFSHKVYEITSEQRLTLHVAAVFANNFTNHLYKIAGDILKTSGLSYDVLKPLIKETAERVMTTDPVKVQTGPAQRKDHKTIKKHMDLLKNFSAYQNIYGILSQSIERQSK